MSAVPEPKVEKLALHQGYHCVGKTSRRIEVFGEEAVADPEPFPRVWPLLEVSKFLVTTKLPGNLVSK